MNSRRRRSLLPNEPSTLKAFVQTGNLLLEKLIAATNGKYEIPIRSFTAEELTKATNNFVDNFDNSRFSFTCRGSWEGRPILVKKFHNTSSVPSDAKYNTLSGVIQDIVTTAQMSHHKNVLKIFGCCLEFEHPALVYESTGDEYLLHLLLYSNTNRPLSWRSRLKIANDIASAVLYLHSEFATPIIYRMLSPHKIIIDRCGTAKLFDFSFSISLPPGKLQVQDDVIGVTGYIDYSYYLTHTVSQKTDVFSFGVLLLILLAGDKAIRMDEEGNQEHIVHYVTDRMKRNEINLLVDPRIADAGETILAQQLQAFIDLALKCTQDKAENRPDMIDVARGLLDITRCFS